MAMSAQYSALENLIYDTIPPHVWMPAHPNALAAGVYPYQGFRLWRMLNRYFS
jgi:hypothetical protein